MNLYEAIKNNANSRLIIKPVSSNDVWLKFKLGDVTGSAKVFIEGSDYGISGFDKISKLSYSSSSDECNYDRGWDVEPKDKELFNKICKGLEDYRAKHPYSLDESELIEAESFDVYSKVMNAPDDALGTLIIDFCDLSYDYTKSYIKRHFDLTLGELVRYSSRASNAYSASLSGKCSELKKFLKSLKRSTSKEMKNTPDLFTQEQLNSPVENFVNDELMSFKILNEAEDNSTEIIKGVIKSKNLPNGTKVSTITDDTFNSIVKDVQSKIPNSDEKEVRNKVAGTLYGMFEESDDIEIRDSSKKAYKTMYNNYSEPIRFQIRNSNGGLLGGSPTLDGAKKIASEKIAEYKDDPWNKDMKVFIERLKESDEEDELIKCEWCGDEVDPLECKKELNLGWICRGCQNALYSRGEHPVYDEQAVYGFDEAESYYVIPKDLQSIIDSYSTNVDDPMYDNGYEVPDELLKLSVEPPKNMRIKDWMRINCPFEYQLDRIPEDWTFDTIHSQPGLFKDLAYEIDSDPREQIYNKLTDLYGDGFTSSLYDSEGFKESDAKILDFEETGGGCLNYVGEVGDYNFVGELNGDLMFIPKSCGINSWEAYQDLHEDHFSDWESHDELIPEVATALDKYAKTIKNPRYRVAVYDDVSRLRYPDESLDEAEGSEDSTEKYWDATTLKQDAFLRLMKFNFDEPHGCQYIITNDANEVERFRADSDEEAIGYYDSFKEGLDSGLIELMPADLNVKSIVPRDDFNETELSDRYFHDLPDDFQKKVIKFLQKNKRGSMKDILDFLMNAKVSDFTDKSLLTQDEFVDLYDV